MTKHEMEYGIFNMSYEEMCRVLDFYKLNALKTNEYTTSELAAFSKRKICKDIKKIVETGKIDDD